MAFTRCILFTCYTREQNTTCKGHLAFQKATISLENDVHSFLHPIIHSFYNKCGKGTFLYKHMRWLKLYTYVIMAVCVWFGIFIVLEVINIEPIYFDNWRIDHEQNILSLRHIKDGICCTVPPRPSRIPIMFS